MKKAIGFALVAIVGISSSEHFSLANSPILPQFEKDVVFGTESSGGDIRGPDRRPIPKEDFDYECRLIWQREFYPLYAKSLASFRINKSKLGWNAKNLKWLDGSYKSNLRIFDQVEFGDPIALEGEIQPSLVSMSLRPRVNLRGIEKPGLWDVNLDIHYHQTKKSGSHTLFKASASGRFEDLQPIQIEGHVKPNGLDEKQELTSFKAVCLRIK